MAADDTASPQPSNSSNPIVHCQCGAISFPVSRPEPLALYFCHCTECRKQSSSAFGASAIYPAAGMWPPPPAQAAKLGVWKRTSDKGTTLECYFCKNCGVRILHLPLRPDGSPKPNVTVKAGCVKGLRLEGAKHIWAKSAVVDVPDDAAWESPDEDVDVKTE
ncbi:glutathione-dependent formaldehyde-activating enzyme domain-containing protein [Purpureocillium lilacinum]|uniref:Glutathione-dependent formaldehyde-activating enzyme domain-containing protein n=1 Tax=Purpureocillium lilacinum TaxID=33203 RepID=A0A179GYY3_PURLI|nr:glutathione-dependent formaldehyde-activating enzyme domain-containing protein [Purpureocillium lilacinum]OAQ82668.1 glutathione-dependent formaldehyde-activating enzyme domain-containing protein [Purpureocillium lilacinum]